MATPFKNIQTADTFWKRLRGFLGRTEITEDECLIFPRATSLHTCFMRFPIDIIFTDQDMRIIKICENVRPWRFIFCLRAYYAVECRAGTARTHSLLPSTPLN